MDFGHEKFISAKGTNLSRNGILCKTGEECPLYSKVFMMMTLPYKNKQRIVNLEGIVVRSIRNVSGWDTGISITSMNHANQAVFNEALNRFNP